MGGSMTRAALNRHFPDLHPQTTKIHPESSDSSFIHYALAQGYLGQKELAGPGSNPVIAEMFRLVPHWLDQDDSKTAWCGIFRGYIGHKAGTGLPPNHFRAAEWARWGKARRLNRPMTWKKGDTVVMTRPGGNHVCFLDEVSGDTAFCLGGNQSNAVTIAPFKLSRITAVRY